MNKKKSVLSVTLSIFLLFGLLLGALQIPQIITNLQDKRLLEQVSEKKLAISTYKPAYESIYDKIYAMASAVSEGLTIDSLLVSTESRTDHIYVNSMKTEEWGETVVGKPYTGEHFVDNGEKSGEENSEETLSNAKLTEYVSAEVDKLIVDKLGIPVSISEEQLRQKDLFVLYAGLEVDGENLLSGIQIYRLLYTGKNFELFLCIDSEFYSIYAYTLICYGDSLSEYQKGKGILNGDLSGKSGMEFIIQAMLEYWGMPPYEEVQDRVNVKRDTTGVVYEENSSGKMQAVNQSIFLDDVWGLQEVYNIIMGWSDDVWFPIEVNYYLFEDAYTVSCSLEGMI